jgi:hypothetical protein
VAGDGDIRQTITNGCWEKVHNVCATGTHWQVLASKAVQGHQNVTCDEGRTRPRGPYKGVSSIRYARRLCAHYRRPRLGPYLALSPLRALSLVGGGVSELV